MKKYFNNIRTLAALLMAGAAFAACSSDDSSIEQPANPAGEKVYTLTVNASKGNASTRALSLDGTALVAKWETTDEVSVFKAENRSQCTAANLLGTISPVVGTISADGDEATFSGDITGTVTDGDKLMLVYHPAAFAIAGYEGQAGTLASASALDCATAAVTASVSGSDITISEASATFTTQTAVLKLTLTTDGTTTINPTQLKMTMSAGTTTLYEFTFSPVAATYTANGDGVLYFALPSATDVAEGLGTTTTALTAVTITYTATVGDDTYTATKTGYSFEAGTYYAGTLTMTKAAPAAPALNITSPSVGQVIGSDGKNYAYGSLPTGVTAVAMIAKVSGTSGLAIALADEEGEMNYDTAVTTAAAHTPTFTGGTWRLPTQNEWKQMFASFGGNDASYSGLTTAITAAGGTGFVMYSSYCSSTVSGSNVYYAIFFSSGVDWQNDSKTKSSLLFKVRPCLAF